MLPLIRKKGGKGTKIEFLVNNLQILQIWHTDISLFQKKCIQCIQTQELFISNLQPANEWTVIFLTVLLNTEINFYLVALLGSSSVRHVTEYKDHHTLEPVIAQLWGKC